MILFVKRVLIFKEFYFYNHWDALLYNAKKKTPSAMYNKFLYIKSLCSSRIYSSFSYNKFLGRFCAIINFYEQSLTMPEELRVKTSIFKIIFAVKLFLHRSCAKCKNKFWEYRKVLQESLEAGRKSKFKKIYIQDIRCGAYLYAMALLLRLFSRLKLSNTSIKLSSSSI